MIIETIALDSALRLTLLDQSRHYFGGYYHVKVLAYCDIPLELRYFENDTEFQNAITILGESVRFERVIEKMAVPESETESVRTGLTDAFCETALVYLSAPDFAVRYIRSEYLKQLKKPSRTRLPRV